MSSLRIGPVEIHPLRHEVYVQGRCIPLTKKEFGVLLLLMEADGDVAERGMILNKVWGPDVYVEDAAVSVLISRVRRKLGDAAWIIRTVRAVGYKASDQAV